MTGEAVSVAVSKPFDGNYATRSRERSRGSSVTTRSFPSRSNAARMCLQIRSRHR